jgi:hypothetical protein
MYYNNILKVSVILNGVKNLLFFCRRFFAGAQNNTVLLFISFLIFPLLFLNCGRYEKKEVETYYLNTTGKDKIILFNQTGKIKISRSDSAGFLVVKAEKVSMVRKKDLDKPLQDLKVTLDTISNEISITGERTKQWRFFISFRRQRNEIDFEVKVPDNVEVKATNYNGKIELLGGQNQMDVSVTNGSIHFQELTGKVRLDATNGHLDGSVDSTEGMKLDVVNGSVNLAIGPTFTGSVSAQVVNGRISRENLNFTQVTEDKKEFKGVLGSSEPELNIEVVNGKIKLHGK